MTEESAHKPREITYFVNGEGQPTLDHVLKVAQILERAGFTPVHEYELTRDSGEHTYKSYDEEVHLHEGERFTATYIGPTPVS
jgi:hypothetical protein